MVSLGWTKAHGVAHPAPRMAGPEPLDYDRLEEYLSALAYGSRLELLAILRQPRALQDIRLAPRQLRPGDNPDRPVARQTIQAHLEKLMDIGVVVGRESPQRRAKEYVVNPQRLYQIMEEFRKVGMAAGDAPATVDATADADAPRPGVAETGPRLVLVHGLREGASFPLRRDALREGRGWVIGRKEGLQVALEYDPFVSSENAEVVPVGGDFALMDLRSSKNGTHLNWRRLGHDERPLLRPGDVVGVGRSLLVFRRD
jgi:hypothetical protein